MKKRFCIALILCLVAVALFGCNGGSNPEKPTAPTNTDPSRELTSQELGELETFLNDEENNGLISSLNLYTRPEEIDLYFTFSEGAGIGRFHTELGEAQRQAVVNAPGYTEFAPCYVFRGADIETYLQTKLGVSLADLTGGAADLNYVEEYDLYFLQHNDYNGCTVDVTAGKIDENGHYVVTYITHEPGKSYVVTLRKTGAGYQFLSNVKADQNAETNSVTGTYEGQTITLSREVVTNHKWAIDMQPSRFVNGYTAVCFYSEKNELQCALMNTAGELTTDPADFEYIWDVDANGRAVAMRPDRSYVYIDTRGNVLGDCDRSVIVHPQGTEATWESADDTLLPEGAKDARIYDNQVVVASFGGSDSGPYGNYQQLYDLEGNRLNETKFRRIGHFDRGLALFDLEGKLGIIDMKGNIVLQSDFYSGSPDASNDFSMNEGYYLYETDGKIGIMKISRSGGVTPRDLSAGELAELETFLQDVSNYGFLGVNVYTRPQEIDAISVFYDGAGLERTFYDEWSDGELQDVLGTTQWDERFIHPFKFAKADVEAFFTAKTGISLSDLTVKPQTTFPYTPGDVAFMFSSAHEAYYVMHGDDAYLYKAQVSAGTLGTDGLYTVYYSDGSTYGIQYAVTLRKTAEGYQFVANQKAE